MANIKKKGFKTLETDYEGLEEQIREHRKEVVKKALQILLVIGVVAIIVELIFALRSFENYDVKKSIQKKSSGITQYDVFEDCLLEYSNDGISCIQKNGDVVWNQAFEMAMPEVEICGEYIVVYDVEGTKLLILTKNGLEKTIETSWPIKTVCIANQGTVAVLMKEGHESQVKLFDKKGKELANGKFYGEDGEFPIDIALSYDGKKLAVDMVSVAEGKVNTTIRFFNFDRVGQNEIDNSVGTYTFENLLVPEIDYVSNSRMIGMGTGKFLVFDGGQKPELSKEIIINEEIRSFFHDEKYIGIVYDNPEVENSWSIKVMDMRGKTIMKHDTTMPYDTIEFLSNGEVCVTNTTQCEIYTKYSIKKFSYEFDKELHKVLATDERQQYRFIFKETVEEVKLK